MKNPLIAAIVSVQAIVASAWAEDISFDQAYCEYINCLQQQGRDDKQASGANTSGDEKRAGATDKTNCNGTADAEKAGVGRDRPEKSGDRLVEPRCGDCLGCMACLQIFGEK